MYTRSVGCFQRHTSYNPSTCAHLVNAESVAGSGDILSSEGLGVILKSPVRITLSVGNCAIIVVIFCSREMLAGGGKYTPTITIANASILAWIIMYLPSGSMSISRGSKLSDLWISILTPWRN